VNAMLTSEARVETGRADRYLAQLTRHTSRMSSMGRQLHRRPHVHGDGHVPPEVRKVETSDAHAVVDFGWGRCIMQATPPGLKLRAEAADAEGLRRIEDGITTRLEKIGRRDRLKVTWQQRIDEPPVEA